MTLNDHRLVLASGSRYRAGVLRDEGYEVLIDAPDVDERSQDHLLHSEGPEALAVALAVAKAEAVARRHPDSLIVAADQVGVLETGQELTMLTKQPSIAGSIAQLMSLSGTTHRLVNAVAVLDTKSAELRTGVDTQVVTMRVLTSAEVAAYVERFEPFDTAGSYRLEDGELMAPTAPFVDDVQGEHPSGVLGMPMPLLRRLLSEVVAARTSTTEQP